MAKYSLISRRILIAGAGGFVGRAAAKKMFAGRPAVRVAGDLSDPAYCRRISRGVDVAYYLAGRKANLRFHTTNPFTFADGNVRPFATFLAAASESRVKKIIYLSSTIVDYAELNNLDDGYVLGKYLNERIFSAFGVQFPRVKTVLVRAAPVYGPGDNFEADRANFIPAIMLKVRAAKREVEVWGRGRRKLQFVYIDDLVQNLAAAEKAKGSIFTVGNAESASVNEIVAKIINRSGKPLVIKNRTNAPDKPTRLNKFSNIVKPRVSLDEGLARTWDYLLRHG